MVDAKKTYYSVKVGKENQDLVLMKKIPYFGG